MITHCIVLNSILHCGCVVTEYKASNSLPHSHIETNIDNHIVYVLFSIVPYVVQLRLK
jgi:hypothetical protein